MTGNTNLKLYIRGWVDAVSLFKHPVVLLPFVALALIKLFPLICVSFFTHPWISGFSVPAVRSIFGEEALHYPQHVLMLPEMFRVIDIAVLLLVNH